MCAGTVALQCFFILNFVAGFTLLVLEINQTAIFCCGKCDQDLFNVSSLP